MALISKTDLKPRLGITGTADDAYLDAVGIQVQAMAEAYCHRRFEVVTRTNIVFDGRGGLNMPWRYINDDDFPLVSVTALSIMLDPTTPSVFTAVTNTPLSDAIFVYEDGLSINSSVQGNLATWDVGQKNFKITYTCGGGLTAEELIMLKQALTDWGVMIYRTRDNGGQIYKEERILNYTYKLTDSLNGDGKNLAPFANLPQGILSVLDLFKRTMSLLL